MHYKNKNALVAGFVWSEWRDLNPRHFLY